MTPLLVLALVAFAIIIVFFAGQSTFVQKAATVGGLAFILYAFVLALIYLMGLVKGG